MIYLLHVYFLVLVSLWWVFKESESPYPSYVPGVRLFQNSKQKVPYVPYTLHDCVNKRLHFESVAPNKFFTKRRDEIWSLVFMIPFCWTYCFFSVFSCSFLLHVPFFAISYFSKNKREAFALLFSLSLSSWASHHVSLCLTTTLSLGVILTHSS